MFRSIAITLTLCLATATAQAALLSRAGGQAYYDDVLNITWMADTNLAASNSFGVTGICTNDDPDPCYYGAGRMTWYIAQSWIGAMNTANYLGTNTWRLPNIVDTGAPGCNWERSGTDCGINVDLSTGEMAHMFTSTLGNVSSITPNGSMGDCASHCLDNTGPFSNFQPAHYWSGTSYATNSDVAWYFNFYIGEQFADGKPEAWYAWAVSDGDTLAPVPVPGAVWLFGSALGLMGLMRRKASA
jgi:hypothetical protein